MRAQESPLARLQRHARDRGTTVAVIEQGAGQDPVSWVSLTWSELHRHVIDGAAGMIEAGVNPGQIVVIRVSTGIRQLELELATRVAGAVPLLLPDQLDPTEVGRLLDEVEVRLVVVDHARRLTLLRRAGLTEAQLFECDDRSWERLRGMGLERRKREPDVLLRAHAVRDRAHSGTVLGLPREKSLAWLFRPEASGALSDLTADDVVLLTGEATVVNLSVASPVSSTTSPPGASRTCWSVPPSAAWRGTRLRATCSTPLRHVPPRRSSTRVRGSSRPT